jgi:hypothetical protein
MMDWTASKHFTADYQRPLSTNLLIRNEIQTLENTEIDNEIRTLENTEVDNEIQTLENTEIDNEIQSISLSISVFSNVCISFLMSKFVESGR